jgi:agmatinase
MTDLQATIQPERPFLDWPVAMEPSGWKDARVALLGICHSEPYSHDPFPNDQSKAPDAIRRMSPSFCYDPAHWDFDVGTDLASNLPAHVDMGNVAFDGGDYSAYAAAITARARSLWRQGAQIIVLGGDHGVTIPVVDALDAIGEPVHILHIDAHLDWREDVGGVRRGYSSPLQWASKVKAVAGMTQIGLRAIGSARQKEVQAARDFGSHLFLAEQIHADGMDPVLATIPAGRPVYLTIDADGLDPTEMPAVMAPTPGGIYFRQLAPLLRAVARRNRIVGMDIVEIAPSYDFANGLTCIAAGRLILNVLSASWSEGGAFLRAAR